MFRKKTISFVALLLVAVILSGCSTETDRVQSSLGRYHVDKDCADFATHSQAQAYFNANGGGPSNNFDNLDADHDGRACEALP